MVSEKSYVHYAEQGDGPLVIWLHGYGEDHRIWPDFLKPFYPHYRCVYPDLPGFGKSPMMESPMSLAKVAQHLVRWMDKEQMETATWIGHSMGGYIALEVLHQFPDRINGLCLLHSHVFADSAEGKERRQKASAFILQHGSATYARELIPKLFAEYNLPRMQAPIQELMQRMAGFSPQALAEGQQAMMNRTDHQQTVQSAAVPIGFVLGELDELFSYKQALEQTQLADRSIVHLLPEVGHMGMWEDRSATQKALLHTLELIHTK